MVSERSESNPKDDCEDCKEKWHHHHYRGGNAGGGAFYGLGLIGALFYFLQNAQGFNEIMIGIFKSVVWPAFVVFRALQLLKI